MLDRVEVKFALDAKAAEAEPMSFSGYGSVFNNIDWYGDTIVPGAFADTLAEAKQSGNWPPMLLQHGGFTSEDNTPIGIWTEMSEDGIGLKVTGKLAETPRGQEIYTLMKMTPRPAINGMSIGFYVKDSTPRTKPEEPRRTIKKVDLVELSVVTFPANRKALIDSVKTVLGEDKAEWALCQVGFSRDDARSILAGGFKSLLRTAGENDGVEALQRLMSRFKTVAQELRNG